MTETDRNLVKAVTTFQLSNNLPFRVAATEARVSERELRDMRRRFDACYPGVEEWNRQLSHTLRHGKGESVSIRLPGGHNTRVSKQAGSRAMAAMVIHGTAALIIKMTTIRIHRLLTETPWVTPGVMPPRLVLIVQNELLYQVPATASLVRRFTSELRSAAIDEPSTALGMSVDLKIDIAVGRSWDALRPAVADP